MEYKTLDQIKNELAKEYGHNSWSGFKTFCFKDDIQGSSDMLAMMNVVCERYAEQEIKKHLEIASNEAKLTLKKGRSIGFVQVVDKESITSIEIKLS